MPFGYAAFVHSLPSIRSRLTGNESRRVHDLAHIDRRTTGHALGSQSQREMEIAAEVDADSWPGIMSFCFQYLLRRAE